MLNEEKKEIIRAKIAGKKVTVFSKSYCPYCKQAKSILKQNGVNLNDDNVMELDKEADGQDIQDFLSVLLNQKGKKVTVPQIFIGGNGIGGCSDLEKLQKSGKLKEMLK